MSAHVSDCAEFDQDLLTTLSILGGVISAFVASVGSESPWIHITTSLIVIIVIIYTLRTAIYWKPYKGTARVLFLVLMSTIVVLLFSIVSFLQLYYDHYHKPLGEPEFNEDTLSKCYGKR